MWDSNSATTWRGALSPLETKIVSLVETEFLTQERPFRVGTHQNSAFALASILDYATVTGNESLVAATRATAKEFFQDDTEYPVRYEPMGWDFLSPALVEANLMCRVLDKNGLIDWIDGFFPDITCAPHNAILTLQSLSEHRDSNRDDVRVPPRR
jgi:hypothetical protein